MVEETLEQGIDRAMAFSDKGKRKEAISILEDLSEKYGHTVEGLTTFNLTGIEYRMIGEIDKALEKYSFVFNRIEVIEAGQTGFKPNQRLELTDQKTLAYVNIADICRLRGEIDDAEEYLEKARKSSRVDSMSFAKAHDQKGLLNVLQEKYDVAVMHHKMAADTLEILDSLKKLKSRDKKHLYLALGNLAEAQRRIGGEEHLEDAEKNFVKAATLANEREDIQWASNCTYGVGKCHMSKKHYEKAIGYFEKSLEMDKKLKFRRGEAVKSIHLAYAHANLPNAILDDDIMDTTIQHLSIALTLVTDNGKRALTENDIKMNKWMVDKTFELIKPSFGKATMNELYKLKKECFKQ